MRNILMKNRSKIHFNHLKSDRGAYLWTVLLIVFIGTVIAVGSSYLSTQRIKTTTDYVLCQRALNNADAGIDRIFFALKESPDTNNDGIFDDLPTDAIDTWGTKIFDIDNNNIADFYQLFGKNKNIPDEDNVSVDDAIQLFITSDDEAFVWAEANTPGPNMATIHSRATSGRCTKQVKLVIQAVLGSPGSGIQSGVFNAP